MNSYVNSIFLIIFIGRLAALDFTKDVEGQNCIVTEPIRNYTFNLTELRTELGYHVQSSDHPEKFSFNVCGGLSRKCNNQEAGACMKDPSGTEVVLGFKESKLLWNEGSLRFSYTGEKCDDKNNYTLTVMLHCDYSGSKNDFIGVFHDPGKCEANIILRTPHACLPTHDHLQSPLCVVKSPNGDVFNFNPLRNYNHKATGRNGTTFSIGICNPVLYGHETACEAGSFVCLYNPKAKDLKSQYKNMGVMTEDFKFEKDFISLTMTSDEICDGKQTYKSKILFECDSLADVSYPTFHATVNCTNLFSWPTELACPDKKSCQVVNAETGVSFDFSSLAGIQYEAINNNNTEEKFVFSVCSDAQEPCMKQSGSCVIKNKNKQSTQAGIANDDLKLEKDGKSPYLLYEHGAVCKKPGNQYRTRINFICADGKTDEVPIVVEDGCDIVIEFKTLLACEYIKNCIGKTLDDEEIDLRPLIDFDGNYVATVNEKALPNETAPVQYLLNVCRPLNSKYSLNCRGSAGACRTVVEKDGKHENEISLGHPDYSLVFVKSSESLEMRMMYLDGGPCPEDSTEKAATLIRFFCDQKVGLGNPILQSIRQCVYSFDFPTNILCNEQNVELKNDSCSLVNDKVSVSVDLKLFGSNGVYKVADKELNICKGAGKFYTIVYKQSLVRIEFSHDNIDVEVQLKCSANNKTTTKMDDRILVMHESPLICPLLKITPKASRATSTDETEEADNVAKEKTASGFALGYVFMISIVILAFVALYLVIRNPERREIIRNLIKFRSTSSPVQYSRVRLNEESLLLNSNVAGLSDSDDDEILL